MKKEIIKNISSYQIFLGWLMMSLFAILNSSGVFLLKKHLNVIQMNNIYTNNLSKILLVLFSSKGIFAILLIGLSNIAYIFALSKIQLSIANPICSGLNFLMIILLSSIFINEQITINKSIGIILIFIGIYYVSKQ